MKQRREYIRRALSVCLLIVYITFQASLTAFSHVHTLNGKKYVHSHPYSSDKHTHSTDQALAIARLSSVQFLEAQPLSFKKVDLPVLFAPEYHSFSSRTKAAHTNCISLRAPPFC